MFFSLQKMSAGFPARHEKARITKDLHICQRFGGRGGEGGRGGGGCALYYIFKSSKTQHWAFLARAPQVLDGEQTSPDSSPSTASCPLGARISQKTAGGGEGGGGDTWAVTKERSLGRDDWPTSPGPRRPRRVWIESAAIPPVAGSPPREKATWPRRGF